MEYDILNKILNPDRILDIALAEKAEREEEIKKRKILIRATQINDFVETLLANPNYKIINRTLIYTPHEEE